MEGARRFETLVCGPVARFRQPKTSQWDIRIPRRTAIFPIGHALGSSTSWGSFNHHRNQQDAVFAEIADDASTAWIASHRRCRLQYPDPFLRLKRLLVSPTRLRHVPRLEVAGRAVMMPRPRLSHLRLLVNTMRPPEASEPGRRRF